MEAESFRMYLWGWRRDYELQLMKNSLQRWDANCVLGSHTQIHYKWYLSRNVVMHTKEMLLKFKDKY